MTYKSYNDSIVFIHEPIEIIGRPPGGGGYNRCLVPMVPNSELETGSEQIKQLVSKSSQRERLTLIVFPDFNRCFRNFAAAVSTIVELELRNCRDDLRLCPKTLNQLEQSLSTAGRFVSSSSLLGVKIIRTIEKYLAAFVACPEFWRVFCSTECYHLEIDLLSLTCLYHLPCTAHQGSNLTSILYYRNKQGVLGEAN